MTENIWFIAVIWMGLAFVASLISIRVGISVALVEILIGVAALTALWVRELMPRHSDLPGEFEEEKDAAGKWKRSRSNTVSPSNAKSGAATRPKPF